MELKHTPIPPEELDVFRQLPDIRVVVDVGARADTDYLQIYPDAEFHLFEPNPDFFKELEALVDDQSNAVLNKYGLSDKRGKVRYDPNRQAFVGGECPTGETTMTLPLETLDWYVKKHKVKRIDFLKVDVEGYDYKVLCGAQNALKATRFVQYEHWDDKEEFVELLGEDFELVPIGYRNVLGMSRKLVSPEDRKKLRKYIEKMGYKDLV